MKEFHNNRNVSIRNSRKFFNRNRGKKTISTNRR
jgi:hypothetical protein